MSARTFFAKPTPYLLWMALSAILLVITRSVDPYIFGFTAFATAGLSGFVLLLALVFGIRQIGWALLGGVPTILAFALLSTYKWA